MFISQSWSKWGCTEGGFAPPQSLDSEELENQSQIKEK